MQQHNQFLQRSARSISQRVNALTTPSLFEYFSAYHLSNQLNTPFYVWKDLTPTQKEKCYFPNTDKGCDVADETFENLGQAKYYEKSTVCYGKLGTFLGLDKYSGMKHSFHLLRSENSKLSKDVKGMVDRGNIFDHRLLESAFDEFVKNSKTFKIEEEIKKEAFLLRKPQRDALQLIGESKRNVKIQLPTGVGKTVLTLTYMKENHDNHEKEENHDIN